MKIILILLVIFAGCSREVAKNDVVRFQFQDGTGKQEVIVGGLTVSCKYENIHFKGPGTVLKDFTCVISGGQRSIHYNHKYLTIQNNGIAILGSGSNNGSDEFTDIILVGKGDAVEIVRKFVLTRR